MCAGAGMRILAALVTGLSVLLSPALAAAQDFPSKPIRLIVPFPAGGPNDIIARVIGQRMSELTRQPVLIDNRGGQAGVLGTDAVAKANPDGYTIGIVSASALVISPTMEKVAYDVAKDFAPVTLVVTVPEMLVVASNLPAKNMAELVALAKAQPGKFNFASAGVGGLPHLAGELFKLTAKIDIVHVPYRGSSAAMPDLISNKVQVLFDNLPSALEQVRGGTLRGLGVTSPQRWPGVPDIPAVAETVPGFESVGFYGISAPKGTPPEIVDLLNKAVGEALKDPKLVARLADVGGIPKPMTPAEFGKLVVDETEKWRKVVEFAGVSVD